jgi:hypothetical protein
MILAYYVRHQLCPLLQGAPRFPNISVKHEGEDSQVEGAFTHPSDVLNRYLEGILSPGDMPHLELNYLDKHVAVNRTAKALTKRGLSFMATWHLRRRN